MQIDTVLAMLLGAALVSVGVLTGALAERIRPRITAAIRADRAERRTPENVPAKREPEADTASIRSDARQALTTAGYRSGAAYSAVDDAMAALGPAASLQAVIKEALRRCKPKQVA